MMDNVFAFGPRDEAVNRQEIVDTLKRLLDENTDLKTFPTNFKLAMQERVWEGDRRFASGKVYPPVSFHDFIHEQYPTGIGASYEVVENLIRGRADVLALWTEVTKRKQGERTDLLDNVQEVVNAPTGNTAAAGIRKLQKAATEGNEKAQAELSEAVEGKKSIHRACVDAGLRKASKIDADVKHRASVALAEWIVEHANGNDLDAVKANLFAVGAKSVAIELTNLLGESIMDRRYGS